MNAIAEQALISKIKTLSPQQVAEVEDFVEFLRLDEVIRAERNAWARVFSELEYEPQ